MPVILALDSNSYLLCIKCKVTSHYSQGLIILSTYVRLGRNLISRRLDFQCFWKSLTANKVWSDWHRGQTGKYTAVKPAYDLREVWFAVLLEKFDYQSKSGQTGSMVRLVNAWRSDRAKKSARRQPKHWFWKILTVNQGTVRQDRPARPVFSWRLDRATGSSMTAKACCLE